MSSSLFLKELVHMEKRQELFWVYILKLIFGLVQDLRRGEASRVQEMGQKPDFNANQWIHPLPLARYYHESHLVLFHFFFLHESLGFLLFKNPNGSSPKISINSKRFLQLQLFNSQ